jgi:O-antigen/teichoic acid export membrane protein
MTLKKNIFYNVLLNVFNLVFPIATAPYIAHTLGVANVGIIDFTLNYTSYFILFAALGVNYYGVREIAKNKNDKKKTSEIFSGIFLINVIATIIITIFYFASIFFTPRLRENLPVFLLAGFSIYLAPLAIDWYFRGLEDFKTITFRSFIVKCVTFAGVFIFVRRREDVIPYITLYIFSTIGAYIWNLAYAKRKGLKIVWRRIDVKYHIKPMLVFFVSNVAISMFTAVHILMLGFLSSYEQVGFFTAPNKVLNILAQGIGSINIALLPRISYNNQQNDTIANTVLLQKAIDMNIFLAVPMVVGLFLIAPLFIPFFFGKEFTGGIMPMQILSFKMIVALINGFLISNILMLLGYESKVMIVLVSTAIISIATNCFLIPSRGAVGAAITSICVESFEIACNLFCVHKFTKVRLSWRMLISSVLSALPFGIIYFLVRGFGLNTIWFLVIFIGISIVFYFFMQYFCRNYFVVQMINGLFKRSK